MVKVLKNTKKAEKNRNRARLFRGVQSIMRKDAASLSKPRDIATGKQVEVDLHPNVTQQLSDSLRTWANTNTITMRALTALLKILNSFGIKSLPKDCRALMKTPRFVEIVNMANGKYWHNGLKKTLSLAFANLKSNFCIEINISTDGLPLFKGSPISFWPLLFNIQGELV